MRPDGAGVAKEPAGIELKAFSRIVIIGSVAFKPNFLLQTRFCSLAEQRFQISIGYLCQRRARLVFDDRVNFSWACLAN